jgi:hypothetical protein
MKSDYNFLKESVILKILKRVEEGGEEGDL